jgi:hypothetical protein
MCKNQIKNEFIHRWEILEGTLCRQEW